MGTKMNGNVSMMAWGEGKNRRKREDARCCDSSLGCCGAGLRGRAGGSGRGGLCSGGTVEGAEGQGTERRRKRAKERMEREGEKQGKLTS
jgi:hypothetical protein